MNSSLPWIIWILYLIIPIIGILFTIALMIYIRKHNQKNKS